MNPLKIRYEGEYPNFYNQIGHTGYKVVFNECLNLSKISIY